MNPSPSNSGVWQFAICLAMSSSASDLAYARQCVAASCLLRADNAVQLPEVRKAASGPFSSGTASSVLLRQLRGTDPLHHLQHHHLAIKLTLTASSIARFSFVTDR
eukprot:TRINITY_DN1488_c0_g3_i1.p1 TRINITY_DN1488_c0_g3~~TRINITY_DN1488_c0_g3_i1.p1  ORF type:complete len:106 (-),score=6.51 TRINITY_DN1488_c0_g3_i1:91-408(-)